MMDQELQNIIKNIDTVGEIFIEGKRNSIKLVSYNSRVLSIKIFKIPGLIKGIIYRFFRKSKAQRSFLFAKVLESKNIGTPKPIAYFEDKTPIRLLDSYYVCEHVNVDFVFKDVFIIKKFSANELTSILQHLARFTFKMHENGIEFLDHSPGNTLYVKNDENDYSLFLVDLNRMKFHKNMSFETRMKNFARITPSKNMIEEISKEYAKLINKDEKVVFEAMWKAVERFYAKSNRKKRLKKAVMFWKK
jgi:hypothetical protein